MSVTSVRRPVRDHLLQVQSLSVERGKRAVLSNIDFELTPGEVLFVIGPNGSGKSTLIDACFDLVHPAGGEIFYAGRPLSSLNYAERPQFMALVGREESDSLGFTVREVLSLASSESRGASRALDAFHGSAPWLTAHVLERKLGHLSQGERQRVHLWRGFLQEAKVLFLDEATAHLDLAHREEALQAVQSYAAHGNAAIVVVHEIDLALRYASRLLVLHEGRTVALGAPAECLTRNLLREVFGVEASIISREGKSRLDWER